MSDVPLLFPALTVAALIALLVAETRGSRAGIWIAKPAASTGFLATALAAGAAGSTYGRWVLAALALCWLGDVLLIPKDSRRAFLGGLTSFLLGHLALAVGFAQRGLDPAGTAWGGLGMLAFGVLTWRWLRGHLPAGMRRPVASYVVVISGMVALGAGTAGARPGAAIAAGALLFAVSDLAVARDRFVAPGPSNRLWGLPLYYTAQLLLAASAAPAA